MANPLDAAQTVDIYDLDRTKASAFSRVDKNSDQNRRYYNGFDVNFQSRMKGLNLFGGFSAGHTVTMTCQTDNPNNLANCDQSQYDIPYYKTFK